MRNRNGFTLFELLVVITIISVLAAIAIPQFSAYRERAYTMEGYLLGNEARKEVQEFHDHTGRFPKDNAEAGLPEPTFLRGKNVESVTVADGAVHIAYSGKFSRSKYAVLSARPAVAAADAAAPLQWVWGADETPAGYRTVGENKTLDKNQAEAAPAKPDAKKVR